MDQKESNKMAKEFCKNFLKQRINEAQRAYERVTACHCTHLGGKGCECAVSEDKATSDTPIENGGTEINGGVPPNFFLKGIEEDSTQGDEKDSFAKSKEDVFGDTNIEGAFSIVDTQTPSADAKEKGQKSLIKQASFLEQVYDGLKDPYVILINNVNFKNRPAPRNGAEVDTKNLRKFLKKAHFNTVECYFDVKKDDMLKIFREAQRNYNLIRHDGLICFIMSHGSSKGITTADNQYIKVDDITALFRGNQCIQFATKPKLFFIQACRGVDEDEGFNVPRGGNNDVEADSECEEQLPVKMPSDSDFLIAYSTTKEKCSYRRYIHGGYDAYDACENVLIGSWFIACLVDVFLAYSDEEDLLSMLTRVNKAMAELYTDMGQKQISCHLSMLTKKVYFPKFMEKQKGQD